MRILAFKPRHDAAVAYLKDGELIFSIEAEKNSYDRYSPPNERLLVAALTKVDAPPDVLAVSGWADPDVQLAPYAGIEPAYIISSETSLFGTKAKYFSSTHERAHLFGAFGMSDLPQGEPFYFINYEGGFGYCYEVDAALRATRVSMTMREPGQRFGLLHPIGLGRYYHHHTAAAAGKVMALAAFSQRLPLTKQEEAFATRLLTEHVPAKVNWRGSWPWGAGLDDERYLNVVGVVSDRIFDAFYQDAKKHFTKGWPLVLGGGCALNCDWNSKWKDSGLFSSVFTPPCPNDSGAAIGTAIEAQFVETGNAKIRWNVYAGEEFVEDVTPPASEYHHQQLDVAEVARMLRDGAIIGWVQGRYEIGPRALCHRSILASPFRQETQDRINHIKQRESFRPVAPVCLEEDVSEHFHWQGPSPYMLYFQK